MHLDQSDIRKTREKHTLQLRKQTREEIFLKRRNFGGQKSMNVESGEIQNDTRTFVIDERFREIIEQAVNKNYEKQQLNIFINELTNADPIIRHQAVIGLRKIISSEQNQEIIQLAIDRGALPKVLSLLSEKDFPQIRFEASWIVSNIAAGTSAHCQAIIDKGGVQLLMPLLNQSHFRLNQQAIWALGNIGGDSIKFRDAILQKKGMESLIKLAQKSTQKTIIRRAAWAISNLCRGTPLPKFQMIKNGIVILAKTIMSQILDDDELSDCLWALQNHSRDGMKSRIQKFVQITNFVPSLINLCKSNPKLSVLIPALRIVGNISIGNELHTQQILKGGALDLFAKLYNHQKKSIRRQVCWITSNLCAGTASQAMQVYSNQKIITRLGEMFWSDQLDVKKEICYVFRNMGQVGDKKSVLQVYLGLNVVEGVMNIIRQDQDSDAISVGLKCLFELLNVGGYEGGQNIILKHLEAIPGSLQRLQSLQHHKSTQIYQAVVKIFQNFFALEQSLM